MNSPNALLYAAEKLEGLPAIPVVAQKILTLKIADDGCERELLELIENDPPILSRIIGLSNSSLFGIGRKILSLHDAAALLGSKRVRMVSLSFAMMSCLPRKKASSFNVERFWQHSLSIAMTMETLVSFMPNELRPSEDEVYLAGLLHNIGFLVLEYLDPELSNQFHACVAAKPESPVGEIEMEIIGTSHCQLGAALGHHWELPESIIAVIRYHHPDECNPVFIRQPLINIAVLAEKLLPTFGVTEAVHREIDANDWLVLGIDPVKSDQIMAKAQHHISEAEAILT